MPLNKQDLQSIENILDKKFDEKFESFTTVIQNNLKSFSNKIDQLERFLAKVENRSREVSERLMKIEKRLMEVEDNIAYLIIETEDKNQEISQTRKS